MKWIAAAIVVSAVILATAWFLNVRHTDDCTITTEGFDVRNSTPAEFQTPGTVSVTVERTCS